jgi:N-acetylglucosamine kinase-like BadF-type ATPase
VRIDNTLIIHLEHWWDVLMELMLSIDGGGSKLSAVLFDNKFRLLGLGISGGVNTSHTSPEDSRANIVDCLNQVFIGNSKIHIDRLYVVFVGPVNILFEELAKYATVGEKVILSEARAGLLAGAMKEEGILALAGTGSDAFYLRKNQALNSVVGAWGPILGDQGSGTWIGQKALQAIVAAIEGWGKQTMIYELVRQEWKLENDYNMVRIIHKSTAPFRVVASVTPLVGKAAYAGDSVALQILRDAGLFMAIQTHCLIRRQNIPDEYRHVVCCGGAWKAHPSMFNAFCEHLQELYLGILIDKPWFEHVMAGPVLEILRLQVPVEEAKKRLSAQFPDYVIKW